jgi:DNA (cytosine-5)-methyltransferase 1
MRHGSLCTGIGGLDLAAHAVYGGELAWVAEYEDHLDPLIHRHFGPILNLRDLTTVTWGELEPVDILTAGYPCQPFSHAGKRKGTDDIRHLWPYIAEAVRVLRPRRVVLENVAGHLSLGFGDVLSDLAEAGYDAEWCVLRASDVGAPHQRARVFIVAADADQLGRLAASRVDGAVGAAERRQEGGEPSVGWASSAADDGCDGTSPHPRGERHGGGQDGGAVGRVDRGDAGEARERERPRPVPGDRGGQVAADTDRVAGPTTGARGRGRGEVGEPGTEPRAVRLRGMAGPATAPDTDSGAGTEPHGGPDESRLDAPRRNDPERLGVVAWGQYAPAIDRWAATLGRPAVTPDAEGEQDRRAIIGGLPADVGASIEWGHYAPAIQRWELALGRPAPAPTDDRGRLAPAFVEWMMGYPSGWVDGLTRTQALKALGNAVVPQQGEAAIRLLEAAHADRMVAA